MHSKNIDCGKTKPTPKRNNNRTGNVNDELLTKEHVTDKSTHTKLSAKGAINDSSTCIPSPQGAYTTGHKSPLVDVCPFLPAHNAESKGPINDSLTCNPLPQRTYTAGDESPLVYLCQF